MYLMLRSVVGPLGKLREGTEIVGAGNLEYRLNLFAKDEIGEFARAFDGMTAKLKGTTVSRDELAVANEGLQSEITVRRQAEHKAQAQLERLNLLHQITRAIGERQDLNSIFQVVVRCLEDQLPVDFACLCLYDRIDHSLTVARLGVKSRALALELAMPERARVDIDGNGLSSAWLESSSTSRISVTSISRFRAGSPAAACSRSWQRRCRWKARFLALSWRPAFRRRRSAVENANSCGN